MRKIFLASDSRARKQLLEIFGLKFEVVSSGVKETKIAPGLSCEALVKKNACLKAQAASHMVKSGVVIGADTIVVCGKQVFGKPKNLKDAHRMLKTLSGRPQWIYSGLCVLDKDNNRIKVCCEKTKIYMDKLSDREIDAYFKVVSPLDKAGSFDIQGKGAFFINRIEGCFYNIVGLPVRRLYRMLKDMGIQVFKLLLVSLCLCGLVTFLAGCSTEYNKVTGQQESYYYSTDREVELGKSMSRQMEKQVKLVDDPLVQNRVQIIGKKIAAVADRKDIDYSFKAIADDEINAVSLPGGFVYVNKGLIDRVASDDELAAVLAHEVGHIVARHSIKKLQAAMGYSLASILTIPVPVSGEARVAADLAFTQLYLGYGREDELLADQLGARYSKLAGYNPRAMITFLEKLEEHNRRKPLQPKNYLKTHPYVPDRIRVVKQELGEKINFDDYINIEDKPHE
ncbi:MAG: Maf and M48 domain-containing protein [Candidatus Omnitrophica bacterium]|nr:Maf and M48 domain-containing protein [Candidatus Omnitrophota bacterium]